MRILFLLFLPLILALLAGCAVTRAEHLISPGMSGREVRAALGEPYSRNRKIEGGVPVDVWLYREVEARADGTRDIRDSAVTLRDDKVISVQALTETPSDQAPVPLGR